MKQKSMNLKGHMTIRLDNVKTGETKKYEEDNMFTNAIPQMVNFAAKHSMGTNPLDVYSTHWSNLLGGLVLFDSAQVENADNIHPSSGIIPIGYGQYNKSNSYTSYVPWGVYNTEESTITRDANNNVISVSMVFDFPTNHSNGTIASASLTHINAGLFGMGADDYYNPNIQNYGKICTGRIMVASKKGKSSSTDTCRGTVGASLLASDGNYVDICIDSENDLKYMFKVCQDGLSIIKHSMSPEKFDVFKTSQYSQSFVEETYPGTFSGTYFYGFYNTDEQMLYFWILASDLKNWNGATSITIHKFDLANKVLTANWKTFQTPAAKTTYNNFAVTDTKVYYRSYTSGNPSAYGIGSYTFSTGLHDVIDDTGSQFTSSIGSTRRNYIINGLLYIDSYKTWSTSYNCMYNAIIDTEDDSIRFTCITDNVKTSQSSDIGTYCGHEIPPISNTQLIFGTMANYNVDIMNLLTMQQTQDSSTNIGNTFAYCNYLATINNLSSPITKTADQTMKVTYTITAESEA